MTLISSYSAAGSDSAITAPPVPISTRPGDTTSVLIVMLRSAPPASEKYPIAPEYTPRWPSSSVSMSSIVRSFGAPVIDPPGNAARTQSTGCTPAASRARTVLTS